MSKVIIIMGSKADLNHSKKIGETLKKLGVDFSLRISSAHKVPLKTLEIIKENENKENIVYIAVAGRSNALSGIVDANTTNPVISCPPYGEKFAQEDIFSSLRMPSGVCPLFVLEPEQAALAAAKILALRNTDVKEKVKEYQNNKKLEIEQDDNEIKEK